MLQQTQVSRVAEKYPRFIKRFPSFSSLARARVSTVIRSWQGMGYNNRAVRLHRLARTVVSDHRGELPDNIGELLSFPGIGRYTAHAVACFAFHRHLPVVDTNIRRVLSRVFPDQAKRNDMWDLATVALPQRNASGWNQALMDLGSTICTSARPRCAGCPVSRLCPSAFRVKGIRPATTRPEPSRDGLPDRIYRGRIVELLRNHPGSRRTSVSTIGRRIKPSFSRRDEAWLIRLMKRLERDGLVHLKNSKRGHTASLAQ
ncbi:MAG TPA: A/G-specific adenine glycosylase [Bacteroidota bacterium]|nr:A/G-specific adenine glycosylase [Bacteroidota bacterium]